MGLFAGLYKSCLFLMALGTDTAWYISGQGDFLRHVRRVAPDASLVVNVLGVGFFVALYTFWNVAVPFAVAVITGKLGMAARMVFKLAGRAGMAFCAEGQQLFYVKAGKGRMGLLVAGLARAHLRRIAVGVVMATRALRQHFPVLHSLLKAVKGFMTVLAGEPVGPLAVFNGHEDFIMTPGAIKGCHPLRHLLRDLAVNIFLLTRCRLRWQDQQETCYQQPDDST